MTETEKSHFSELVKIEGVQKGHLLTLYDQNPDLWVDINQLPPSLRELGQICRNWIKPEQSWQGPEAAFLSTSSDELLASFVYYSSASAQSRYLNGYRLDLARTFNRGLVNLPLSEKPNRSSLPEVVNIHPYQSKIGSFVKKNALEELQPEDVVALGQRVYIERIYAELFSLYKSKHSKRKQTPIDL